MNCSQDVQLNYCSDQDELGIPPVSQAPIEAPWTLQSSLPPLTRNWVQSQVPRLMKPWASSTYPWRTLRCECCMPNIHSYQNRIVELQINSIKHQHVIYLKCASQKHLCQELVASKGEDMGIFGFFSLRKKLDSWFATIGFFSVRIHRFCWAIVIGRLFFNGTDTSHQSDPPQISEPPNFGCELSGLGGCLRCAGEIRCSITY